MRRLSDRGTSPYHLQVCHIIICLELQALLIKYGRAYGKNIQFRNLNFIRNLFKLSDFWTKKKKRKKERKKKKKQSFFAKKNQIFLTKKCFKKIKKRNYKMKSIKSEKTVPIRVFEWLCQIFEDFCPTQFILTIVLKYFRCKNHVFGDFSKKYRFQPKLQQFRKIPCEIPFLKMYTFVYFRPIFKLVFRFRPRVQTNIRT